MKPHWKFAHEAAPLLSSMAAVLGIIAAGSCAAQTAWKPDKLVEFVVGSTPGGGNDKTARSIQKIWQDAKWLENVVVVNKPGGGGAVAYTYVSQRTGDAHFMVVARKALLTNHILGRSPLHYTDVTPLAIMTNEPTALAVRTDSPLRNVKDLIERLKTAPDSITTSVGSTRGGPSHMLVVQLAKIAGADLRKVKVITFGGSTESVTNLLGGHIEMMSASVDAMIPHHKSGTMRIIGLSAARRAPVLPNVATFREQGHDIVMGNWTAIVGPKGLAPAPVAYWENLLERTYNTTEWQRMLEADALELDFRKSQATREAFVKDYEQERALLTDLGMAK